MALEDDDAPTALDEAQLLLEMVTTVKDLGVVPPPLDVEVKAALKAMVKTQADNFLQAYEAEEGTQPAGDDE